MKRLGQTLRPRARRRWETTESPTSSELDQAKIATEKQLAVKANAESHVARFEFARKLVLGWVLTYGVLGVFSYNVFDIRFFPSGLTFGDALVYAFVALGLGLLSVMLAFAGGLLFYPLMVYESTRRTALEKPPPCAAEQQPLFVAFASGLLPILTVNVLAIPAVCGDLSRYLAVWVLFGAGFLIIALLVAFPAPVAAWSSDRRLAKVRRLSSLGWGRKRPLSMSYSCSYCCTPS